jgi:hypothetical protein
VPTGCEYWRVSSADQVHQLLTQCKPSRVFLSGLLTRIIQGAELSPLQQQSDPAAPGLRDGADRQPQEIQRCQRLPLPLLLFLSFFPMC